MRRTRRRAQAIAVEERRPIATDTSARARRIGDYIAGMTDRYALIEHAKYFKDTPELR